MPRLIITNGDSAAERLRAAGAEDEILVWADVLHDGPAPAGMSLEEFSAVRARFLSDDLDLELERVAGDFQRRDAALRAHERFDTVELWFEHDLYDQLQLIQILDFFASESRSAGLLLMQADDYLGLQSEQAMRALDGTAKPVTPRQMQAASESWAAFTAATPEAIVDFALGADDALPYLRPALKRLLAELPALGSGVSLTEERALKALVDGPQTVAALFKTAIEQEAAQFLGDASFFRRLDGLCFVPRPLIEGLPYESRQCTDGPGPRYREYASAELALTEAGRRTLAGDFDHARENGVAFWLGGTQITPDKSWRWDRVSERLISP